MEDLVLLLPGFVRRFLCRRRGHKWSNPVSPLQLVVGVCCVRCGVSRGFWRQWRSPGGTLSSGFEVSRARRVEGTPSPWYSEGFFQPSPRPYQPVMLGG